MVKKPPALGELEQPATPESPDFLATPAEYGQSMPGEESVPGQTGWEQAPEEGLSDLEKWRLGVPLTSVDATPEETAKSRNIAAFKQAFPTASDKTNATFSGLVNGDEGITMVDAVDAEQEVGDFGIQWEGEGRGLRYGRILRSSLESMWANPDTQYTGKRAALLAHAKRYYKTVAKPENEEDLASWFDAVAGDFIRKEQAGRLIGPYDPLELEERSFFGAAYETTKGVGARLILARDFSKKASAPPKKTGGVAGDYAWGSALAGDYYPGNADIRQLPGFMEYAAQNGYPTGTGREINFLALQLYNWKMQREAGEKKTEELHPLIRGFFRLDEEQQDPYAIDLSNLGSDPAYAMLLKTNPEVAKIYDDVARETIDPAQHRAELDRRLGQYQDEQDRAAWRDGRLPSAPFWDPKAFGYAQANLQRGAEVYRRRESKETQQRHATNQHTKKAVVHDYHNKGIIDKMVDFGRYLADEASPRWNMFLDAKPPTRAANGTPLTGIQSQKFHRADKRAFEEAKDKKRYVEDPDYRAAEIQRVAKLLDLEANYHGQNVADILDRHFSEEDKNYIEFDPGVTTLDASLLVSQLTGGRGLKEVKIQGLDKELEAAKKAQEDWSKGEGVGKVGWLSNPHNAEVERLEAAIKEVYSIEGDIAKREVDMITTLASMAGGTSIDTDPYGTEQRFMAESFWADKLILRDLVALIHRPASVTLHPDQEARISRGLAAATLRPAASFKRQGLTTNLLDVGTWTFAIAGMMEDAERQLWQMEESATEDFVRQLRQGNVGDRADLQGPGKVAAREDYWQARKAAIFDSTDAGIRIAEASPNLTAEQKARIADMDGWEQVRLIDELTAAAMENIALFVGGTAGQQSYTARVQRRRAIQQRNPLSQVMSDNAEATADLLGFSPTQKKWTMRTATVAAFVPEILTPDLLTGGIWAVAKTAKYAVKARRAAKLAPKHQRKIAKELRDSVADLDLAILAEEGATVKQSTLLGLRSGEVYKTQAQMLDLAEKRLEKAVKNATTQLGAKISDEYAIMLEALFAAHTGITGHYMRNIAAHALTRRKLVDSYIKLAKKAGVPDELIYTNVLADGHLASITSRESRIKALQADLLESGVAADGSLILDIGEARKAARAQVNAELLEARKIATAQARPFAVYARPKATNTGWETEYFVKDQEGKWYSWFSKLGDGTFRLNGPSVSAPLSGAPPVTARTAVGTIKVPNTATGEADLWQVTLGGLGPVVDAPLGATLRSVDDIGEAASREAFGRFSAENRLTTWNRVEGAVDEATPAAGRQPATDRDLFPQFAPERIIDEDGKHFIRADDGELVEIDPVDYVLRDSPVTFTTEANEALAMQRILFPDNADALDEIYSAVTEAKRADVIAAERAMHEAQLAEAHARKNHAEGILNNWEKRIGPEYRRWEQARKELEHIDEAQESLGKGIAKQQKILEANSFTDDPHYKAYKKQQRLVRALTKDTDTLVPGTTAYEAMATQLETAKKSLEDFKKSLTARRKAKIGKAQGELDRLTELNEALVRRRDLLTKVVIGGDPGRMRKSLFQTDEVLQRLIEEGKKVADDPAALGRVQQAMQNRLDELSETLTRAAMTDEPRIYGLSGVDILATRRVATGKNPETGEVIEGKLFELDQRGANPELQVGDRVGFPGGEEAVIIRKQWNAKNVGKDGKVTMEERWVLDSGDAVKAPPTVVEPDDLLQEGVILKTATTTEVVVKTETIGRESLRATLRAADGSERVVAIPLGDRIVNTEVPITQIDDLLTDVSGIAVTKPIGRTRSFQEPWILKAHGQAVKTLRRQKKRAERDIKTLERKAKKSGRNAEKYGKGYDISVVQAISARRAKMDLQKKDILAIATAIENTAKHIEKGRDALKSVPIIGEKYTNIIKDAIVKEPWSAGYFKSRWYQMHRTDKYAELTADGDFTIKADKLREALEEAWGKEVVDTLLESYVTGGATRGGAASDTLAKLLGETYDEKRILEYEAKQAANAKARAEVAKKKKGLDRKARIAYGKGEKEKAARLAGRSLKLKMPEKMLDLTETQRAGNVVVNVDDFEVLQGLSSDLTNLWKAKHADTDSIAITEALEIAVQDTQTLIGDSGGWMKAASKSVRRTAQAFNPIAFDLGNVDVDVANILRAGKNIIHESNSELNALALIANTQPGTARERIEYFKEMGFKYVDTQLVMDLDIRAPIVPGVVPARDIARGAVGLAQKGAKKLGIGEKTEGAAEAATKGIDTVAGAVRGFARPTLSRNSLVNTGGRAPMFQEFKRFTLSDPYAFPGGLDGPGGLLDTWREQFTKAGKIFEEVHAAPTAPSNRKLAALVKSNPYGADLAPFFKRTLQKLKAKEITPEEAMKSLRKFTSSKSIQSAGISSDPAKWSMRASMSQKSPPFAATFLAPLEYGHGQLANPAIYNYFYRAAYKILKESDTAEEYWSSLRQLYMRDYTIAGMKYMGSKDPTKVGDVRGLAKFFQGVISGSARERVNISLYHTYGALVTAEEAQFANKILDTVDWATMTPDEVKKGLAVLNRFNIPAQKRLHKIRIKGATTEVAMGPQIMGFTEGGGAVFGPGLIWDELAAADPMGMIKNVEKYSTQALQSPFGTSHGLGSLWRQSVVTGIFSPRWQYFGNNYFGDLSQIGATLGNRQAIVTSAGFLAGMPTWLKGVEGIRVGMAKHLGVDADSVLPSITESMFQTDVSDIMRGGNKVYKTATGEIISSKRFRNEWVENSILESYAKQDFIENITDLSKGLGFSKHAKNWSADISNFASYAQQRQRAMLYSDLRMKGYTAKAAKNKTLEALYDWKYGLARWEAGAYVTWLPFGRFWRLATGQAMKGMLKMHTRPNKESIKNILLGRTYLGRTRAQSQLSQGAPFAIDPIIWEDMPGDTEQEKKANAEWLVVARNYLGPDWHDDSRIILGFDFLQDHEKEYYNKIKGGDNIFGMTQSGPLTTVETLTLLTAISNIPTAAAGWVRGQHTMKNPNLAKQVLEETTQTLWPITKEIVNTAFESYGMNHDSKVPQSWERLRPTERLVFGMLDRNTHMLEGLVQYGDTAKDMRANRALVTAFRYTPGLLELTSLSDRLVGKNPEAGLQTKDLSEYYARAGKTALRNHFLFERRPLDPGNVPRYRNLQAQRQFEAKKKVGDSMLQPDKFDAQQEMKEVAETRQTYDADFELAERVLTAMKTEGVEISTTDLVDWKKLSPYPLTLIGAEKTVKMARKKAELEKARKEKERSNQ